MGFILNIFSKILPLFTGIFGKLTPILFNILAKIGAIISSILEILLTKIPILRDFVSTLSIIFSRLREKLPSFEGKDLSKVYHNPWIIANGIILIVALSMTAVIISWFETKTQSMDTAIETIDQLKIDAENEIKSIRSKKPVLQTFIVKEDIVSQEQIEKAARYKYANEMMGLLNKANKLFDKGEFETALPFYGALNKEDSDIVDAGFVNLRIGECLYNLGRYNDAIDSLDQVPKNFENKYKWHSEYLAGESYIAMGDYDNGRKKLYTLIAMGKKCPSDSKNLIENSYFRIADSFLEETLEKTAIRNKKE